MHGRGGIDRVEDREEEEEEIGQRKRTDFAQEFFFQNFFLRKNNSALDGWSAVQRARRRRRAHNAFTSIFWNWQKWWIENEKEIFCKDNMRSNGNDWVMNGMERKRRSCASERTKMGLQMEGASRRWRNYCARTIKWRNKMKIGKERKREEVLEGRRHSIESRRLTVAVCQSVSLVVADAVHPFICRSYNCDVMSGFFWQILLGIPLLPISPIQIQ